MDALASTDALTRRAVAELRPHRRAVVLTAVPAAAWAVPVSGPGWATPAFVVLALAGAALGVVDARTHRLPDAISLPASAAFGLLLVLGAVADGAYEALGRAAVGAAVLGAAYWLLHRIHRSGLGYGDVKLAPALGAATAWAGWDTLVLGSVAAFVLGGLVAVVLLATHRARRDTAIPFGPFMLAGAALALTLTWLAAP